jgi:hypothetical protein
MTFSDGGAGIKNWECEGHLCLFLALLFLFLTIFPVIFTGQIIGTFGSMICYVDVNTLMVRSSTGRGRRVPSSSSRRTSCSLGWSSTCGGAIHPRRMRRKRPLRPTSKSHQCRDTCHGTPHRERA